LRRRGGTGLPGGSYVASRDPTQPPVQSPLILDVTESFATSITLSLATIGFCRVLRSNLTRKSLIEEVGALEALASRRLTAALVGLLRSFAINVFSADSGYGRNLLRTINQQHLAERTVVERIGHELREVRVGLRDYITIGA